MDAHLAPLPLILRPADAIRGGVRLFLIALTVLRGLLKYFFTIRRMEGERGRAQAAWLSEMCRKAVLIVGMRIEVHGTIPSNGLIVANHLSYLDPILLSAIAQPIFVSKVEIAEWPLFGICARLAGTVFVNRQRRGVVGSVSEQMRERLMAGMLLVLFAEGTTSGGESVLPFKPSLFAAVTDPSCPVTACAIEFLLPSGSVSDEVYYWRDHTLPPHLFNLLTKTDLTAQFRFGTPRPRCGDRKQIAQELHAEVVALRQA